jgi:hypothetical protein
MTLTEKRKMVMDFIERTDPYHKKSPTTIIDLRAYANYVEQNHIQPSSITEAIMMKFVK